MLHLRLDHDSQRQLLQVRQLRHHEWLRVEEIEKPRTRELEKGRTPVRPFLWAALTPRIDADSATESAARHRECCTSSTQTPPNSTTVVCARTV
jgi:hypothetical protein